MNAEATTILDVALTVKEAAKRLRIGKSTLYLAAANGEVPCIRIGGTVRIPSAWVERVLVEGWGPPPSPRATSRKVTPIERGRRRR